MANTKPSPCVENAANPNNSGVVLDVPCYEGSGTPHDVSVSGETLSITGTVGWSTDAYGNCLNFTGAGSVTTPVPYTAAFTALMSIVTTQTTASDFILWNNDSAIGGGSARVWQFRVTSSGQLQAIIWNSGGSLASVQSAAVVNDGALHRVGMMFDGSDIYTIVDGVVSAGVSQTGVLQTGGSSPLLGNGSGIDAYTGTMDGVTLYNKALTALQITQDAADAFARFRAISPVQASTLGTAAAATSANTSFGSLPTIGNAVRVDVWGSCSSGVTGSSFTITDNQAGNTYSPVVFKQESVTGVFAGQWLLPAVVGSSGTFTVTVTGPTCVYLDMQANERNPGLTADQTHNATGTGETPDAGAVTTATANEEVALTFANSDATSVPAIITAPVGNAITGEQTAATTQAVGATAYQVFSTTQSGLDQAWATNTPASTPSWAAVVATYKGGTSPPPPPTATRHLLALMGCGK